MPDDRGRNVLISVRGVHKSFGPTPVLRGADIDIYEGQTTVVLGPSGCGKSVLLKHMIGLLSCDEGCIKYDGNDVTHLRENHWAAIRREMGFLFQSAALFDSKTVEQNIIFPMIYHSVGDDASRIQRCRDVLAMVGLVGMENRYPAELSGGQQQRVALARAMILNPRIIFYDEPTTGLDPIRSDIINELILKLKHSMGNTAVVVTHDMTSARKVADRIVMLHEGRFILDTTPQQIDHVQDENVRRFLEGRAGQKELCALGAVN
ncbi:MAG TPA: ATP-binding cassette domain-containing protein [Phycisphaerae bacterium]|nr:ATP-binding cassette domain-containing protein [Phycisphaerae bacterium]